MSGVRQIYTFLIGEGEFIVSASTKYSSLHIKSSLLIFWCEMNIDIKKTKKITIEINSPELFS